MKLTPAERVARWRTKPGNQDKQRRWASDFEKRNKSRRKSRRLEKAFGITLEERDAMLEAQGGGCACCGGDRSSRNDWHVDHNHETGEVRGVLCHHCNVMIGFAKDDPERLRAGASYLERLHDRLGKH